MNVVSVPSGIHRPSGKVDIPSAWEGAEMKANPDRWLISLAAGEIAELEGAAETYLGSNKKIAEITKESFPLPYFGAHLEELKKRLLVGLGFEVIRGLPVAKYSQEFAATIFCGVGAHLGSARSQNAAGHILGHVRDTGADAKDPNTRIYQTSERQTFHTDSSDVVGLLCIREAMEEGILSLSVRRQSTTRCLTDVPTLPLSCLIRSRRTDEARCRRTKSHILKSRC